MAGAQNGGVFEQSADDLQRLRQAIRGEAAAHRERRVAADIERGRVGRAGEQRGMGHRLKLSGRLPGRQQHQVDRRENLLQGDREVAADPHRLHVILGPDQASGDDAVAQAVAEQLRPGLQILFVDRIQLGHRDDLLGVVEELHRRRFDRADLGAEIAKHRQCGVKAGSSLRRQRRFLFEPAPGHADDESGDPGIEAGRVILRRQIDRAQIFRVVPGHDRQ